MWGRPAASRAARRRAPGVWLTLASRDRGPHLRHHQLKVFVLLWRRAATAAGSAELTGQHAGRRDSMAGAVTSGR
jgi:hypothetical protein